MKEHPFTSLCELLKKQDPKVMSIFNECAVSSVQQNQMKPRLTEMIVATIFRCIPGDEQGSYY